MLRFIEDLGVIHPTPGTRSKKRMILVECTRCKEELRVPAGVYRLGHKNPCKSCLKKEMKEEKKKEKAHA